MLYLGQSALIDMGLYIGNGVSPIAADDAEDVPHCPNAYVTDVPRNGRVAPERMNGTSAKFAFMCKRAHNASRALESLKAPRALC